MSTTRNSAIPYSITVPSDKSKDNTVCFIFLKLGIFIAAILYALYGVKSLWEDRYMFKFNSCYISHLWQAALVVVVFIILGIIKTLYEYSYTKNEPDDPNTFIYTVVCLIFIISTMIYWFYIEVYSIPYLTLNSTLPFPFNNNLTDINITSCNEIANTNIWQFEQIALIIYYIILSLLVIVSISYCCAKICCSS